MSRKDDGGADGSRQARVQEIVASIVNAVDPTAKGLTSGVKSTNARAAIIAVVGARVASLAPADSPDAGRFSKAFLPRSKCGPKGAPNMVRLTMFDLLGARQHECNNKRICLIV